MKYFLICITMDCWKLACEGLFQDTEEEESVITYPHLHILPITSAHNPRNISPQFTRLNIRSSAHLHFTRGRGWLFHHMGWKRIPVSYISNRRRVAECLCWRTDSTFFSVCHPRPNSRPEKWRKNLYSPLLGTLQ